MKCKNEHTKNTQFQTRNRSSLLLMIFFIGISLFKYIVLYLEFDCLKIAKYNLFYNILKYRTHIMTWFQSPVSSRSSQIGNLHKRLNKNQTEHFEATSIDHWLLFLYLIGWIYLNVDWNCCHSLCLIYSLQAGDNNKKKAQNRYEKVPNRIWRYDEASTIENDEHYFEYEICLVFFPPHLRC